MRARILPKGISAILRWNSVRWSGTTVARTRSRSRESFWTPTPHAFATAAFRVWGFGVRSDDTARDLKVGAQAKIKHEITRPRDHEIPRSRDFVQNHER